MAEYKDAEALKSILVGDERTYKLKDNMFHTVSKRFSGNVVHIGMDAAFHLGLGKYLEKNGYFNFNKIEKIYAKIDYLQNGALDI